MGFVTGDAEKDCEPIRKFVEAGIPLLVAATYGKAFGLYGERVGHLCVTAPNSEIASRIEKQMKLMARAETGAMPRFGSLIVSTILGDAELKRAWEADLREIARQLHDRRVKLKQALEEMGAPGDWNFITGQKGMFLWVLLLCSFWLHADSVGTLGLNPIRSAISGKNTMCICKIMVGFQSRMSDCSYSCWQSLMQNRTGVSIRPTLHMLL